jgi:hypothetical protein
MTMEKKMETKKINLDFHIFEPYDVVVAGGGCAGVVAALAAARNGAKTLLIERAGYLGGMLTGGLVHSLHGYRLHKDYMKRLPVESWETPLVVKGITLEILKRLQDANGTANKEHYGDPSVRENYDAEVMMYVLDQMMEEEGVKVLYNTFAIGTCKDGNRVTGIMIVNKSGRQVVNAGVVIDATGDADIAAEAGVEFEIGVDGDPARVQGASLLMEVGGIDIIKLLDYLKVRPEKTPEMLAQYRRDQIELTNGGVESPDTIISLDGKSSPVTMAGARQSWKQIDQAYKEGRHLMLPGVESEWMAYLKAHPEIPFVPNTRTPKRCYPRAPKFNWYGIVRQGKIRYDQTYTGLLEMMVDQSNEDELSKAITLMRKFDHIYLDFFRTCIPGFEDAYIMKTSPMVGTRESRRIAGVYVLTAADCENGVIFEDAVAYCGRALNLFNTTGQGGILYWIEPKDVYTLPYRMMLPIHVDSLLVAGRCSSIDLLAFGGMRAMPSCMSLGEAAGTAAALSVQNGVLPRNLDIGLLQDSLRKQGVLLPDKG